MREIASRMLCCSAVVFGFTKVGLCNFTVKRNMSIFNRFCRSNLAKQFSLLPGSYRCYALAPNTIETLVKKNKVVVFMKGVPEEPRCGFSNAVVQILSMHGVKYESYDVLKDEDMRQGIKEFSNWPTIPQVYINGEFVGGCDILLQMHQNGELIEELKKAGIKSALLDAALRKPDDRK